MKVYTNLEYAEFYITNHCNLTCNNCNRFNNHKISGSADWEQYRDIYAKWSNLVAINRIAFLGGEPLLHPKLHLMLSDVRLWWPYSEIEITTNGLLIPNIKPDLHQSIIDNKVTMYISIHNENWVSQIKQSAINSFGELTLVDSFRINPSGGSDTYISSSGIKVILEYTYHFRPAALQTSTNRKYKLHKSNPDTAHNICDMKHSFHFWKGCLYKCGIMVTLPYVIEQKNLVDIDADQLSLLNAYKPLTYNEAVNNPTKLNQLRNSIAQCEFCPNQYAGNHTKIFQN